MLTSLPPVQSEVISAETLDALLLDLELQANVREVRVKAGPQRRADEGPLKLADAAFALKRQLVSAIQVHYEHHGTAWLDTLTRCESGYHLVRIAPLLEDPSTGAAYEEALSDDPSTVVPTGPDRAVVSHP